MANEPKPSAVEDSKEKAPLPPPGQPNAAGTKASIEKATAARNAKQHLRK